MQHLRRTKFDRRRTFTYAVSVVSIALVIVGGVGVYQNLFGQPTTATAVDMRGKRVAFDAEVAPIPASVSKAVEETGDRFIVPSVGLDVPLGALNEVGGQIVPPGFSSAYWVRNMGVSVAEGATGTVYVVMHSIRGGGTGPGNYLIDVDKGASKVPDGAEVTVANTKYTVTGWQRVNKDDLASNADVWANTPNRLVIITCQQRTGGLPSVDNLVITAVKSS